MIGPRKYRTASADVCAAYLAIVRVHYSAISGLNGSKPCAEKRSGTRWAMPCPIMQSMRLCRVDEALREAAGKALTDRAARGARQVEEYYCRESTLHRAAHVRERIESGVTQSDIGRIAGRSVGTDKSESARSAKRTGLDIRYTYPRLWHTKAETLAAFTAECPDGTNWALTRSCWQGQRQVSLFGKWRQYGICAACMLRCMSGHAMGGTEDKATYIREDSSAVRYEDGAAAGYRRKQGARRPL